MALYKVDLTGKVFGMLTVVGYSHNHPKLGSFWSCVCECGKEKLVQSSLLKNGNTRSCGHWKSEFLKARATHGEYGSKLYRVWNGMLQRCTNPNAKAYPNYGGRGIVVCEEWKNFVAFRNDMGPSYQEGLTLDRIDNDGPYNKGNCKWSTRSEQIKNRRPRSAWKNGGRNWGNQRFIETPDGLMIISQAAEHYGLPYSVLYSRIAAGWDVTRAVHTPPRGKR